MKLLKFLLIIFVLLSTIETSYSGISSGVIKGIVAPVTAAALSIGSSGATSFTIPIGKTKVQFQNTGTGRCWYGDSDIAPATARGNYLEPGDTLYYDNVDVLFVLYFRCASGVTTTISPITG